MSNREAAEALFDDLACGGIGGTRDDVLALITAALDAAERRGLERAEVLMSSRATDLRNDDRTRRFCAWAATAIRALTKP